MPCPENWALTPSECFVAKSLFCEHEHERGEHGSPRTVPCAASPLSFDSLNHTPDLGEPHARLADCDGALEGFLGARDELPPGRVGVRQQERGRRVAVVPVVEDRYVKVDNVRVEEGAAAVSKRRRAE